MEGVGEGELVGVVGAEAAVEGDVLASVIEGGFEVFDFGGELEVL